MEYCESAKNIGFQNGDIPLSADGVDLNYMSSETLQKIVDAKEVKVLRDNDTVTIEIPKNFMLRLIDKERTVRIIPYSFCRVRSLPQHRGSTSRSAKGRPYRIDRWRKGIIAK